MHNAGAAVGAVSARLESRSANIEVLDAVGTFLPCGEGDSTRSTGDPFRVRVSASSPIEVPQYCSLVLDAAGYHDTLRIPLIVGDSMNLPDGPDAYGYVIYDHTDSLHDRRAAYDWVELRGVGTELLLGADETTVLPLPAAFGSWRYYGEDYDSISICSNGFVTAGASDRVDLVNVQLPYSRAPGNAVALVWDDLDLPSGGHVWFHHDIDGRRFIVEFDSVRYFGAPGKAECVQLQIYDASVSTPTGDNRLEVHFQTVMWFDNATVGLQNHDGSTGLTHHVNGWRPLTAAPLQAGRALAIEPAEPAAAVSIPSLPELARLGARPAVFRNRVRLSGDAVPLGGRLTVLDVGGRRIVDLESSGTGEWSWDGRDAAGEYCASGTYFFRTDRGVLGRAVLVAGPSRD
jgi:hypothetical protein